MDFMYIIQLVTGFLGIFLLGLTYTYIDKLEKTGCACSEHKYRKFIKNYCLFAIAFIALVMFVPPSVIPKYFGEVGKNVLLGAKVLYMIASFAFYIMAIIYARYLMKEKCKCSEDMRREIMFVYAIFELVLISTLVVGGLFLFVVGTSVGLASSVLKEGSKHADTIMEASVDPLKSAKKVSKKLGKSLSKFRG